MSSQPSTTYSGETSTSDSPENQAQNESTLSVNGEPTINHSETSSNQEFQLQQSSEVLSNQNRVTSTSGITNGSHFYPFQFLPCTICSGPNMEINYLFRHLTSHCTQDLVLSMIRQQQNLLSTMRENHELREQMRTMSEEYSRMRSFPKMRNGPYMNYDFNSNFMPSSMGFYHDQSGFHNGWRNSMRMNDHMNYTQPMDWSPTSYMNESHIKWAAKATKRRNPHFDFEPDDVEFWRSIVQSMMDENDNTPGAEVKGKDEDTEVNKVILQTRQTAPTTKWNAKKQFIAPKKNGRGRPTSANTLFRNAGTQTTVTLPPSEACLIMPQPTDPVFYVVPERYVEDNESKDGGYITPDVPMREIVIENGIISPKLNIENERKVESDGIPQLTLNEVIDLDKPKDILPIM